MKNKVLFVAIALLLAINVSAQDYGALDKFMKKYDQTWNDQKGQLGKPMPEFNFDDKLNSKALKGKFVVLNFWATWCGGCRLLAEDLDSLMIREPNEFKDVQLIGVNSKEELVNKGYKAEAWWKSKGFGYPTTAAGIAADKCEESIEAGHPTAVLIDDKGIIRGRWDAWTSGTAEAIRLATWVLYVIPKQHIDANVENVRKQIAGKKYLAALYLLDQMGENEEVSILKFKTLVFAGENEAATSYFSELQNIYKGKENYGKIMKAVAASVLESTAEESNVLKVGQEAAFEVLRNNGGSDYKNYEVAGVLRWRYGESIKRSGLGYMDNAIKVAEQCNVDSAIIEKMKINFDKYNCITDPEKKNESNKRVMQTEKDEKAHKESLKDIE